MNPRAAVMNSARPFRILAAPLLLSLAFSGEASAGSATLPFQLESTAVLPRGVRNPRLKSIFSNLESRFDAGGRVVPLGSALDKGISFQELVDAQPTDIDRANVQGLKPAGLAQADLVGRVTGEVNVLSAITVPCFAYGVTERFTLAAALPVYRMSVSAATGFVKTAGGEAFVANASNVSAHEGELARQQLNQALPMTLAKMGYRPVEDETFAAPGDLRILGKYRLFNSGTTSGNLVPSLSIPLGRGPDADRLVDAPTTDGQVDVGASFVSESRLDPWGLRNLSWVSHVGYVAQLADRLERRIPTSAGSPISADKEKVERNLGDQITVGSSLGYAFGESGWSAGAGWSFVHQAAAQYRGTSFADARYRYLEGFEPEQSVHGGTLNVGYSRVPAYRRDPDSVIPLELGLNYTRPLSGRNATRGDIFAGELVLFF